MSDAEPHRPWRAFSKAHSSAYTGYIDVEARHLFFYFFESRSDPDKDDVILWTNGGKVVYSPFSVILTVGGTLLRARMLLFSRFIYGAGSVQSSG